MHCVTIHSYFINYTSMNIHGLIVASTDSGIAKYYNTHCFVFVIHNQI